MSDSNHLQERMRGYWRWNRRLIATLLIIWAVVSYGFSILFIEQLNKIEIGSIPLGFWFAQQGSIYVFVLLVLAYALLMDKADRKFGLGDTPADSSESRDKADGQVKHD